MKKFLWVFLALITLMLTGCGGGKEVYSGEGYKFAYDPDKWELIYGFDDGSGAVFKSKDFGNAIFHVFHVVSEENVSLSERLESSKEIICGLNDHIWVSGEILDIDGREWYREEYQTQIGENKNKTVDFFTDNGTYAYSVGFSSDIDSFDKGIKDFEKIFDSFKFTE